MMRVGIGYDVHRFDGPPPRPARHDRRGGRRARATGRGKRPLKLGGVTVPSSRGLSGHSDADVLLHAVADALFGALGAPDLGEQFPSSDARYRGADSRLFIARASAAARRKGLTVGNVDATVVADAPRLAGYKVRMARSIGRMLDIGASRVSVKAKTTEGFAPARDGIAAHAVVLLLPLRKRATR